MTRSEYHAWRRRTLEDALRSLQVNLEGTITTLNEDGTVPASFVSAARYAADMVLDFNATMSVPV